MENIGYLFAGLLLQSALVIIAIVSVDSKRRKEQQQDFKRLIKYEILDQLEPKFDTLHARISRIETENGLRQC